MSTNPFDEYAYGAVNDADDDDNEDDDVDDESYDGDDDEDGKEKSKKGNSILFSLNHQRRYESFMNTLF